MMERALVMRLPGWTRLIGLGVLVVIAVMLGDAFRQDAGNRVWAPLFLVFAVFATWRSTGLAVVAGPEEMRVRNGLRSVTLARSEITGFRVDRGGRTGSRMVYAERRDGPPVGLDVTTDTPLLGGTSRLQHRLEKLEAWRTGRPADGPRPARR